MNVPHFLIMVVTILLGAVALFLLCSKSEKTVFIGLLVFAVFGFAHFLKAIYYVSTFIVTYFSNCGN